MIPLWWKKHEHHWETLSREWHGAWFDDSYRVSAIQVCACGNNRRFFDYATTNEILAAIALRKDGRDADPLH